MSAALHAASDPMRSRVGAVTYLTPKDSLADERAVRALRKSADACVAAGENRIVVELTHVRIVNGGALETFLDLQDELLELGGWLKLGHASDLLREVFAFTGIADYVSYADEAAGQSSARLPQLLVGPRKFGDLLVARGLVAQEQVDEALELQRVRGEHLGRIIAAKGWVSEQKLLK
ncbi:MAG TPA: hypothetical protein VFJ95_16405, partial [Gammaproteobacteria bacterium]|nr:hypothetical protein [Gammaproteobacteria bacterium]